MGMFDTMGLGRLYSAYKAGVKGENKWQILGHFYIIILLFLKKNHCDALTGPSSRLYCFVIME